MEYKPRVDDEVWYTIRVRAKIIGINDSRTHVGIEITSGELKGQMIQVPLEMIHPVE